MNRRSTPSDAEQLKQVTERRALVAALAEAQELHREVHEILYEADDIDAARTALVSRFGWREIDANAVLDMQQRRLPRFERDKIVQQLHYADERIAELEDRMDNGPGRA